METGNIVRLCSNCKRYNHDFYVELIGTEGKLAFGCRNNPYDRLKIVSGKEACFKGGGISKANIFTIEYETNNVKLKTASAYLACNSDGKLYGVDIEANHDFSNCLFQIINLSNLSSQNTSHFKKWQLRRLFHEGYVQMEQVVESMKVVDVDRILNHHLGLPSQIIPGGIQKENLGKFQGHLSNSPDIVSIIEGNVDSILNEIFAPYGYEKQCLNVQIAYRFPELSQQRQRHQQEVECDTEFIDWHTDGFRQGKAHSFSLLLGLCLSDVTEDFCGNLLIWPGSHLVLHPCIRNEYGGLDFDRIINITTNNPCHSDLKSSNNNTNNHDVSVNNTENDGNSSNNSTEKTQQYHDNEPQQLPSLGKPIQIKMRRGDIILVHPDVAHAGAPNYSHNIRKMLYFRIKMRTSAGAKNPIKPITISDGDNIEKIIAADNTPRKENTTILCSSWEDVVQEHRQDMWVDLPIMRNMLGYELETLQRVYADDNNK